MTIETSRPTPSEAPSRPQVAEVFAYAEQHVCQAAAELWPGVPVVLGEHVPSVTGYVQRLRVGDRPLYAKLSFLGVSLVSLLRGACGSWEETRRAQREYEERPDGLLAREAAQLRLLRHLGRPVACELAGLRRGVMFTEPVTGPTLANALLTRPEGTARLLAVPFGELAELHRPRGVGHLSASGVIAERSIAGTFLRKFNGISGDAYVDRLGVERCAETERAEVMPLLRSTVARLRRLRLALVPTTRPVLVYGELKPEHVIFPHGIGEPPAFVDPGLMRAGVSADVAKLISRTALLVAAVRPGAETAARVADGIGAFVIARAATVPHHVRPGWLREVLALWLMDTVNITSTYLSAPAGLPLPAHGAALVERAAAACRMVEAVGAELAAEDRDQDDAAGLWERALAHLRKVGS